MTIEETIEYFELMTDPLDYAAYELCPCFEDHYEMAKIALEALKALKAQRTKEVMVSEILQLSEHPQD